MIKGIAVFIVVGVAVATPIIQEQYDEHAHQHDHHYHEPNYEFGYSVHDGHTGDVKSQHEVRHGDNVEGQYSLLEPDGHTRTVHYQADKHNGFNAVVQREGHVHHQQAPIAHAAPISHHVAVPLVQHHNPFAHNSHAAIPLFDANYQQHGAGNLHQPLHYSQGHAHSSVYQTQSNQHHEHH